jgi:hypothetical protein
MTTTKNGRRYKVQKEASAMGTNSTEETQRCQTADNFIDTSFDYSGWMGGKGLNGEQLTDLSGKRLVDLMIPGSHDTGTYSIFVSNTDLTPAAVGALATLLVLPYDLPAAIASGAASASATSTIVEEMAVTQDCHVYQQLKGGVRYLNLRPANGGTDGLGNPVLVVGHGPIPGAEFTQNFMVPIAKFIENDSDHKELIIILFESAGDPPDATALKAAIQQYWGQYMVKGNSLDLSSLTMQDIWNRTDGNQILLLADSEVLLADSANGIWSHSDFECGDWPNMGYIDKMLRFADGQVANAKESQNHNKFFKAQLILTPGKGGIGESSSGAKLADWGEVRGLTRHLQRSNKLWSWWAAQKSSDTTENPRGIVMYLDFIFGTDDPSKQPAAGTWMKDLLTDIIKTNALVPDFAPGSAPTIASWTAQPTPDPATPLKNLSSQPQFPLNSPWMQPGIRVQYGVSFCYQGKPETAIKWGIWYGDGVSFCQNALPALSNLATSGREDFLIQSRRVYRRFDFPSSQGSDRLVCAPELIKDIIDNVTTQCTDSFTSWFVEPAFGAIEFPGMSANQSTTVPVWHDQSLPDGPDSGFQYGIGAVTVQDQPASAERPFAFLATDNGHLWGNRWNGANWIWEDHGTPGTTAIQQGAGLITVMDDANAMQRPYAFVIGHDGNLWVRYYTGKQWKWENHGNPGQGFMIQSAVGSVYLDYDSGGPYAFLLTQDANGVTNAVWSRGWNGSNWNWNNQTSNLPISNFKSAAILSGPVTSLGIACIAAWADGKVWALTTASNAPWNWVDCGAPTSGVRFLLGGFCATDDIKGRELVVLDSQGCIQYGSPISPKEWVPPAENPSLPVVTRPGGMNQSGSDIESMGILCPVQNPNYASSDRHFCFFLRDAYTGTSVAALWAHNELYTGPTDEINLITPWLRMEDANDLLSSIYHSVGAVCVSERPYIFVVREDGHLWLCTWSPWAAPCPAY